MRTLIRSTRKIIMPRSPYRRKASTFVDRLHDMLTNAKLACFCGFAPDGKSFYVTQSKELIKTVLPQVRHYFKYLEHMQRSTHTAFERCHATHTLKRKVALTRCVPRSTIRATFRSVVFQAQSYAIIPSSIEPVLICQGTHRHEHNQLQPSAVLT